MSDESSETEDQSASYPPEPEPADSSPAEEEDDSSTSSTPAPDVDAASPAEPHSEHTDFGDYQVYADDFPASLDPASNAIHETEFHTLETAWDNIHQGTGLDIQGNDADKAAFDSMLADGLQHSDTFRHTIETIGTDTTHTEHVNLGHNQANTFGDSFATNAIDLSDMSEFPSQPEAGHHNEATQTELLEHVLEERHYAQTHDANDFAAAHQHAIDSQNQVRDELGQSHVVSQQGNMHDDGTVTADFHYADGEDELIDLDANADITNITPPTDQE